MISISFLTVFAYCLAFAFGESQEEIKSEVPQENPNKLLTEVGYLRYGDPFYVYPTPNEKQILSLRNPGETNEIENPEPRGRPLFIFTSAPLSSSQKQELSQEGPYIEIRKKRDVSSDAEVPESSLVEKLRSKRSHCKRCGGGGYGGYGGGYAPVSYSVYPVYTSYRPVYQPVYQPTYVPSYGGGCNTCGGGGGHGGSGSYSYSSSSSKSSSGSWGYGK